jgi:multidrug resistance efflux pump
LTALDHMLQVHRWLCREKQRDLEELERLTRRLRADLQQLQAQEQNGVIDAGLRSRRERLEQSVVNADGALTRARDDLAQARVELGHIERREASRAAPLPEPFRHAKRARGRRS